jgi:hypothetical protein
MVINIYILPMNIELTCNHCKQVFEVPYKLRNKKFCNQSCYLEYSRLNKTLGKKEDLSIRETRECVECGNKFIVKKNHTKKNNTNPKIIFFILRSSLPESIQ